MTPDDEASLQPRGWSHNSAWIIAVLIVSSCILLHANFSSPFLAFDDEDHFDQANEKTYVEHLTTKAKRTYIPLAFIAHKIDFALFGPPHSGGGTGPAPGYEDYKPAFAGTRNWAMPVRIESGILHALAGFILWLFMKRLTQSAGIAAFVAVAWTLHPMACESVCWISERKNILTAIFGFSALLTQTYRERRWRWPLMSVLYLLACLSKPLAIGFLPVFIALEFLFFYQSPPLSLAGGWWSRLRPAYGLAIPVAITLAIMLIGISHHRDMFVTHIGGSLFTALLTDLEIFARYITNTFFPSQISFFYGIQPILSFADSRVYIYGFTILMVCISTVAFSEKRLRPVAIFGWFMFFGALGPASNIAPVKFWMQDRYAYFSVPGALLALACGVSGVLNRFKLSALPFAALFVLMLGFFSYQRSYAFQDFLTLSADAVAHESRSGIAHLSLGQCYMRRVKNATSPEALTSESRNRDAQRAIEELTLAGQCTDITNFIDVFYLRTNVADMYVQAKQYDKVEPWLAGWLPPKHLKPIEKGRVLLERDQGTYYELQTLAFAWIYVSESRLQRALELMKIKAPLKDIAQAAEGAADAVENSLNTHILDYDAYYLKAKIYLLFSDLEASVKQPEAARNHFNDAKRLLEMIPRTSGVEPAARKLLERVKPPV